jgi:hypothetical protein
VRKHRFGPDGYLQELPPVNEVDTPPQPGTSLSGPQMRGLIEVQTQVAKGGISVEAGIANLRFALGVTEEAARALIADHGTSFVVEPEDVVPTEDAVPPSSQDQPGAMD